MFKKLIEFIKNVFAPAKPAKASHKSSPRTAAGKGGNQPRKQKNNRNRAKNPQQAPKPQPKKAKNEPKNKQPKAPKPQPQKTVNAPQPALPMPELIDIEPAEGKKRFCDIDLAKEVLAGTQQLGFKYCSVIQEKCLPYAVEGRDLAAKAQTGTGKTAAFLASSMTRLLRNPKTDRKPRTCRVLVLEPTRELAMQIEKDAQALGKYTGLYCKAIFGGMDYKEQRDAINYPVDILAGTPGRIIDYSRSGALDLSQTEVLVIDEADRMLDMGFIPDVRRIVSKLPPAGQRQTMLFSATLDPEILRLVDSWLVNPVSVEAEPEHVVTDLIDQHFYAVSGDKKLALLLWLIKHEPIERMIIFGNWKHKNAELAEQLISYGVDCEQLSGDIAQNKRIRILDRFKSGECKIVVATDVAARGIDVDDVDAVFNYDVPQENEYYVHRIGRTGRAKRHGVAYTLVADYPSKMRLDAIAKFTGNDVKPAHFEGDTLVVDAK